MHTMQFINEAAMMCYATVCSNDGMAVPEHGHDVFVAVQLKFTNVELQTSDVLKVSCHELHNPSLHLPFTLNQFHRMEVKEI